MKHLMNTKTEKLTRRGFAFLLALVLTTSAFVPGLTARATEEPTDPTVVLTGETTPTTVPVETTVPTQETTVPTEETTVPTEETTVPTEETVPVDTESGANETVPVELPDENLDQNDETEPKDTVVDNLMTNVLRFFSSSDSKDFVRAAGSAGAEGLTLSKATHPKGDGTYDLELTLKGTVGSSSEKQKLDLIFVIDRSASMTSTDSGSSQNRMALTKTAATNLIKTLESNTAVDARYKVLDFGGSGHPKSTDDAVKKAGNKYVVESSEWFSFNRALGANEKITQIENIAVVGQLYSQDTSLLGTSLSYSEKATNYQAAFVVAQQHVNTSRSDALKVVVFLTDGKPTCTWDSIVKSGDQYTWNSGDGRYYYRIQESGYLDYNWEGVGTTNEGDVNVRRCLDVALNYVDNLTPDMLYFIGTGSVTDSILNELKNNATGAGLAEKYLVSSNQLNQTFANIAEKINQLFYTNVGVTDILKHSSGELVVDLIPGAKIMVSVYDGETLIAEPATSVSLDKTDNNKAATLTTSYNANTHTLDLVFPDDYKLEPTYTYKMSTVIQPTEKAYQMYRAGGYDKPGQSDTGELSGQMGFHTNDSAKVTYDYSGITGQEKAYAFPIIQLDLGKLEIVKNLEGLSEDQIKNLIENDGMSFAVQITYPADTSNNKPSVVDNRTISLKDMTRNGTTFTWSIDGLSPNTTYSVIESGGTVQDFDQATTVSTTSGEVSVTDKKAEGTVGRKETVTVSYTNSYTIAITEITVEKQVEGNLGDWGKDFAFTASIAGSTDTMNGIQYIKYDRDGKVLEEVTVSEDEASFCLKDDECVTFTNVPLRSTLTIRENPENYELTNVEATNSADLTKNNNSAVLAVKGENKVTFTNKLEATIETGIALDSIPYIVILVGVAAVVGFLFLRKRRRED